MFSVNEQGSESRCTRFLVRASTSKTIVFLLENLTANGCNFGSTLSSFVNCEECPEGSGMSGGFAVNIPKENIQTALRDKSGKYRRRLEQARLVKVRYRRRMSPPCTPFWSETPFVKALRLRSWRRETSFVTP